MDGRVGDVSFKDRVCKAKISTSDEYPAAAARVEPDVIRGRVVINDSQRASKQVQVASALQISEPAELNVLC